LQKITLAFIFIFTFLIPIYALQSFELTLEQCKNAALKNSPKIKSAKYQAEAAKKALDSCNELFYPKITFDAFGSYTATLASLSILGNTIEMGDNWIYLIGPSFIYTIFENGERISIRKSAKNLYEAKLKILEYETSNLLFEIQTRYFIIQSEIEKLKLFKEHLKVTIKQLRDITVNYKAGLRSELDMIMAKKQNLNSANDIEMSKTALIGALRSMFELTVDTFDIDSIQCDDISLKTDNLEKLTSVFEIYENALFDENIACISYFDKIIEYYNSISKNYSSKKYPKVSFKARSYRQYPNGPLKENITQGLAELNVSFPLFESGSSKDLANSNEFLSLSSLEEKTALMASLKKEFYCSKDKISSIKTQIKLAKEIINNNRKAAKIIYVSYNLGKAAFLDVQITNFELSKSEVNLLNLKIEKLIQLSLIQRLSK
jgi:outer membrane protein TolC